MKRFNVLFVLAIFILSMVPAAFAEEGNDNALGGEGGQEAGTQDDSADVEVDASAENAQITATGSDTESGEMMQETARNLLKMRASGEIGEAKSAFVEAKDRYKELKDSYLDERATFIAAKKAFVDCKSANETDCNSETGGINTATRHFLINAADLILGELERVKEKVSASEQLSDEEKADILADIEERIDEVTSAKATVESMDTDTPRENLNEAGKTIREAWKTAKIAMKKHLGALANARLGNIIQRSEQLVEKLQGVSDKLAEKGNDVSTLNVKIDAFNAKIDEADAAYEEAKSIYAEAKGDENFDSAVKEAHAKITEASKSLKEARTMLRDAVKEIKALNKGSLDTEDADTTSDETV